MIQHEMTWERDTSEYVDDNNWVIREPTGVGGGRAFKPSCRPGRADPASSATH